MKNRYWIALIVLILIAVFFYFWLSRSNSWNSGDIYGGGELPARSFKVPTVNDKNDMMGLQKKSAGKIGVKSGSYAKLTDKSVSGNISHNQIWSGVITITGDTFIDPAYEVVIEPGTIVKFLVQDDQHSGRGYSDEFISSHNDPTGTDEYVQSHSDLTGRIIADGVSFTSAADRPDYADWVNLNLNDGSKLINSTVEYCLNCVTVNGDVLVKNNIVHHGLWSCLDDHGGGEFIGNTAHHCWHQCIGLKGDYKAVIKDNTVYECYTGINIEAKSGTIEDNTVYGNIEYIRPLPAGVVLKNNKILPPKNESEGGTYKGRIIYSR